MYLINLNWIDFLFLIKEIIALFNILIEIDWLINIDTNQKK